MAKKERRMAGIQIRPRLVILLLLLLVILGLTATSQALARTWGNSPTPVVPWSSFLANASPFGFDAPQPIRLGETPLQIRISDAGVDAEVEVGEIRDGAMLDPSSSFVVAWYRASGRIGSGDNIVMAGHLDYWDVGPAVFYNVPSLQPGALIEVGTQSGASYSYTVESVINYSVEELTAEKLQEIVGTSNGEILTLITCGGPFDYARGVYLERVVVRARPLIP